MGQILLITAFEPFGGESVNPSWEVARRLPPVLGDWENRVLLLPVSFRRVLPLTLEAVEATGARAVLCLGQAGGRKGLTPERLGINVDDARMSDNDGDCPVDRPIAPEGPAAYFSPLPVKAMQRAMEAAGVPAQVSNSCGTYVCNHLLYGLLHYGARKDPELRCGFLHLPWLPEQVLEKPGAFSLPLEDMLRGVEAAISAL